MLEKNNNKIKRIKFQEIWKKLSKKEREFIKETAGKLDLGPNTDLERIIKYIEEYEDY